MSKSDKTPKTLTNASKAPSAYQIEKTSKPVIPVDPLKNSKKKK